MLNQEHYATLLNKEFIREREGLLLLQCNKKFL